MSFADEKRSILFTGYTAMGNGLTFEQFKEVATNAFGQWNLKGSAKAAVYSG